MPTNLLLLVAEAVLYFTVMAALFRLRALFGIGVFFCVLGTMHFLETYLAAIFYVQLPLGIFISPGSVVLFSGKLVMLLLVYIREDAATVRQPIYGLLFGNFLIVALVSLLRFHGLASPGAGRVPDLAFLDLHGDLIERNQGAVSACHAVKFEQRHGQCLEALRRSRPVANPNIPSGANRTKAMKIRPK